MDPDTVCIPVTGLTKIKKPWFIMQFLFRKGTPAVRGEAYIREMYRAWVDFTVKMEKKSSGTFPSFNEAVKKMERDGIIEQVREEINEKTPTRFPRRYFSLAVEYHEQMVKDSSDGES